ncbi:MAG: hypothetical protein O3A95_05980 [Planctomycetota bacterium]|nr:hypothetical protein [Planctomycetota bacterium]MDA1113831.1 hypothetical protein [Planctomycetota bacterium]
MFRYIVASAAVMTLAVGASAQTQQISAGNLHRTVAPTHGVYNLTTGFEVSSQSYRSGPETIFDNTDGIAYYFTTVGGTQEWIDSMAFAADEISGEEQINGFDYAYCSLLADAAGNAITTEVRFYNDNPGGMEPTGWTDLGAGTIQNAACAYGLAGLPGDTSGGGISCWNVAIDLACSFECSVTQELTPGGFTEFNGIGWMYLDAASSGATGPLLGSTITAAGPGTAVTGYGSQDLFELMDLAVVGAEHQGTFWFGGPAKAQATFDVTMFGDGIANTDVVNATAPLSGDVLCLGVDGPVVPGATVTWSLDAAGAASRYAMLVSSGPASLAVGGLLNILVNPGSLLASPLPMNGAVPSFSTTLPGNLPPRVYAQAVGFTGAVNPANAIEASNALRHNN